MAGTWPIDSQLNGPTAVVSRTQMASNEVHDGSGTRKHLMVDDGNTPTPTRRMHNVNNCMASLSGDERRCLPSARSQYLIVENSDII